MTVLLEVINLSRSFTEVKNNPQTVLNKINFTVHRGEFVAILGKAGSGKSILLAELLAMDRATSGSIRFNGVEINELEDYQMEELRLKSIGFVSHSYPLQKNLTIRDNILQPAMQVGLISKTEIEERANWLMKSAGIQEIARVSVSQAEKDQILRAAFCRELINNPDLLVLDAVAEALETEQIQSIMDFLKLYRASHEVAILLTTHDPETASFADRVLLMSAGEIIADVSLGNLPEENSGSDHRLALIDQVMADHDF